MATSNVTRATEIRKLNENVRIELAKILDVGDTWRKFVTLIPQSPTNQQPLYRSEHIQVFSEGKRSPTLKILDDWGTRGRERPTVQNLIEVFVKAELFRAADYLAIEALHESPLPRPSHGPNARILPSDSQMDVNFIRSLADSLRREKYESKREKPSYNESISPSNMSQSVAGASASPDSQVLDHPPIWSGYCGTSSNNLDSCISSASENCTGHVPPNSVHYLYSTLRVATNGFEDDRVLGRGGFGTVYWGILPMTTNKVAVKRIDGINGKQFKTEVEVLSIYRHENLLPLLGYSCDNPVYSCLVYAFMENGSVQDRLALLVIKEFKGELTGSSSPHTVKIYIRDFVYGTPLHQNMNGTEPLDWQRRISIATGTTRGIVFLHTHGEKSLVHRDVKSANVLLDENFVPKVGDFGVVRAGVDPEKTTVMVTQTVGGTPVYMSDEALRGNITIKMDTFSFGIVLFELLTGLPPYDEQRPDADLLSHMEENCENISEFLDAKAGDWPAAVSENLYELALLCTQRKKKHRPTLEEILPRLESLGNLK